MRKLVFFGLLVCSMVSKADYNSDEGVEDGRYSFELAISRPNFTAINFYSEIYGNTSWFPSFSYAYKPPQFSPWFDFDFGLKLSYYMTTGKPLVQDATTGDYVQEENAKITLKLVPYELYAKFELVPFGKRYVTFSSWVGYEEMYYEEVRILPDSTASKSSSSTSKTTKTRPKNEINSGWNKSLAFGFGVNLLLNHFEERPVRSLGRSMGLHYVYLTPYIEFVNAMSGGKTFISQQKVSPVEFSRTVYGLAFKFDT